MPVKTDALDERLRSIETKVEDLESDVEELYSRKSFVHKIFRVITWPVRFIFSLVRSVFRLRNLRLRLES